MKTSRSIVILLLLVLTVTACAPAATPTPSPTPITVQLGWTHQSNFFSGFYAADQLGYYAAEGLAVSFMEGGPNISNLPPQCLMARLNLGLPGPMN